MHSLYLLTSSFIFLSIAHLRGNSCEVGSRVRKNISYVAAVLEYEPYNTWTEDEKGYGVIARNAQAIAHFASLAKNQSADILVTPEYGVQSLDMRYESAEEFITFTQFVPEPLLGIIPCRYNTTDPRDHVMGMKILSCAARENSLYLVVDLAELYEVSRETEGEPKNDSPEHVFFNTQVVFDRSGSVIARYRKQNLFHEDSFTPGPEEDTTAIFVTDFDVLFTLQVCFDIMYEHPGFSNVEKYGIRDVAYSTAWVDELPFDLANSNQNGWSEGMGVNLLASGYHYPENYNLGSGIYKGYSHEAPVYTFDKDSGDVLLVSAVSTLSASSIDVNLDAADEGLEYEAFIEEDALCHFRDSVFPEEENRTHAVLHQDLTNYTKVLIRAGTPGEVQKVVGCTKESFCCELDYTYSGNQTYYLMAFSGSRPVGSGSYYLGTQQCGIVWCYSSDPKTCARTEIGPLSSDAFGKFHLSSSDFQIDSVFLVGNRRDYSLIHADALDFEVNGNYSKVSSSFPVKDVLSVALYGRWYSRDHSLY